jgi:cytosine/adenosine deaminase-related metal-dependent hydrolase
MDGSTLNDDDDFLQEIRLCLRLHRPIGLQAQHLSPTQAFTMVTVAGARAARFGDQIGRLTVGRRADRVLLRMDGLRHPPLAVTSVLQALLLRAKSTSIDTVMIDGQIVLHEGALTAIDKEAIEAELAAEASQELTGREREREQLIAATIPYVMRFYEDWALPAGQPFYQVNSRALH